MDRNFLIVAADGKVREALAADLREQGFTVTLAESASQAERVVQTVSVQSVVIESHLPDMPAEELRTRLLQLRPECQVVLLTSYKLVRNTPELLRFGSSDYLLRAGQVFDLLRAPYESDGNLGAWPWEEPGNQALVQVIDVLVGLLEIEHRLFGSSSHLATLLARATAEEMGVHGEMVEEVELGSLLRDVGKAGIDPQSVADTDGSSDEQQRHVAEHVSASLRLFEHIDFRNKVLSVVRHHHERYNGSGYPDGLRGREIPMAARIVGVVDAYVAMTGRKENPLAPETALQELVRQAGRHFDPEVVEAFHRVMDRRLAGRRPKGKPVILIMEPDSQFRRLLKMRLLNEDLDVQEAESYEQTMELLLKRSPDLALINVELDPSEAFQLLHDMQQDKKLCRLPIAFLARRHDRLLKIRALRQGVDDFLCKSDDMEELIARVENILHREAVRADGEVKSTRRGISGNLESLSLADIIQTLTIGLKTACVSLNLGEQSGKIWFENGTLQHAKTKQLKGEEAFYEMVRWQSGEFVIEHGVRTKQNSISADAMFLLMEGLRLMDEEGDAETAQAVS